MLALILAVVAAQAAPAAAADPLAPARSGGLQCYGAGADPARKTCQALAGYTFGADGVILNQAEVIISPSPLVTMKTVSPVTVKDGAVCGPLSGIDQAQITIEGQPADDAVTAQIRAQLSTAMAPMLGKQVCTAYRRDGDSLVTDVTIDGVARPEMKSTVLWVSPTAGYVVRP